MPSAAWRREADERIAKHRQGDFTLRFVDSGGTPVPVGKVRAKLARHHFSFGVAVNPNLLTGDSPDALCYEAYVRENFNTLVAENCMKWYAVEQKRGRRDWREADVFMAYAEKHDMAVRGHCLFWSKTHWVQPWARNLPKAELRAAVRAHLEDAVERYRGRLIAWDVNNEMLDGDFYEQRLGQSIRPWFFRAADRLDPDTPLFLNEYTTLENERRHQAYLALIRELLDAGVPVGGIGIQEHDAQNVLLPKDRPGRDFWKLGDDETRLLVPTEVWRRLDDYQKTGLPVHLTEITSWAGEDDRRAEALADFYRLGFAHPGVESILLWGFWEKCHFRGRQACLYTADWTELPAGRALRQLLNKEWTTTAKGEVGGDGEMKFRGFYGKYTVTVGREEKAVSFAPGETSATVVV